MKKGVRSLIFPDARSHFLPLGRLESITPQFRWMFEPTARSRVGLPPLSNCALSAAIGSAGRVSALAETTAVGTAATGTISVTATATIRPFTGISLLEMEDK
ncbi:hypothetical protein [Streptosporangium sp. NPDC051022]|uniref:hypothetical protein n=1 Tax=Streptosporangium sp. NPDC051022 TaxID=3155752 RepID=UPI003418FF58